MKNRLSSCLLLLLLLGIAPLAAACGKSPEHSAAAGSHRPGGRLDPASAAPRGTATQPGQPGHPRSVTDKQGTGHLTLTGDHVVDVDLSVGCFMAGTALDMTFVAPTRQKVVLHVPDIGRGTAGGKFKSNVRVVVIDLSETGFRQSVGTTEAEVALAPAPATLAPSPRGELRQASGTFEARYAGEAGKGTIKASFKGCIFQQGSEE